MNHKVIQKNFILYIDGNLSTSDSNEMQEHLSKCQYCKREFDKLSTIWRDENALKRITPSPYLWQKLELRLNDENKRPSSIFINKLIPAIRLTAVIIILFLAVLIGRYLGTTSMNDTYDAVENEEQEYILNTYRLDSFELISQESIGQIFTLTLNESESEMRR